MSPAESAAMEAFEEAGVEGRPERSPLGHYEYQKWGGYYRVAVYLFEVERELEDWPEASQRRRRWVRPHKARNMVAEPSLRDLLHQAERAVVTATA